MELAGVFLGRFQALAFLRDDMQKDRRILFAQVVEHVIQRDHVVPVHRADILETHLLKHCGVVDAAPHQLLAALQRLDHRHAHDGDILQHRFHLRFGVEILGVGAQFGQVVGHLPDIFGDRHLVVVQDHDQVVEHAEVVHPLVDHAAGERAVAHDDDDFARLFFELFRARDPDRRGQRRAAVPGYKGVAVAFGRVGEAGDAVFLAQRRKTGAPPRQQLMGIALVADVKQQFVLRQVQGAVQRNGELHHAQVGGKMPPGGGNASDQKTADLLTQARQVGFSQQFYIPRRLYPIQQRVFHCPAPRSRFNIHAIGIAKPSTIPRTAPVSTSIGVWPTISLSFLSRKNGSDTAPWSIHSLNMRFSSLACSPVS